jgi:acetyl esterase/lipase
MPSRHLVDAELLPLLDVLPDLEASAERLEAMRETIAQTTRDRMVVDDDTVEVTEHFALGPDGAPDVRIRLYRPKGLPKGSPIIFQIHGGGMIIGTAELGDPRNRDWAKRLSCAVASVDYRLAPEHVYPAAVLDCYAGLKWVHENAESLGLDPNRIAVRGESAGGLLAAALTLYVRDHGGPKIALSMLIYPMLDDRVGAVREAHLLAGQYVWSPASNVYAWSAWLGRAPGGEGVPYHAAPARAPDLAGLPPTFITVGALDLFLDEDMEYAHRLIRAGVPTELYVSPGAFHGSDNMMPTASVSRMAEDVAVEALRRAFSR